MEFWGPRSSCFPNAGLDAGITWYAEECLCEGGWSSSTMGQVVGLNRALQRENPSRCFQGQKHLVFGTSCPRASVMSQTTPLEASCLDRSVSTVKNCWGRISATRPPHWWSLSSRAVGCRPRSGTYSLFHYSGRKTKFVSTEQVRAV